ncbi:RNA-binding domain-containing protein [Neoconidiobolus thromboides FSU 785]|nr:RNA-binding domain-containing protein [Neoconidiobolus thromboides FSU 785]
MSGMTTIYVRGFSPTIRAKELAVEFEKYGPIIRCDIPMARTKHAFPFAFVEYANPKDAEAAMQNQANFNLNGSKIYIEWARTKLDLDRLENGPRHRRMSPRRRSRSPRPKYTGPGPGPRSRSPRPRYTGPISRSPYLGRRYRSRSPLSSRRYRSRSPHSSHRYRSRSPYSNQRLRSRSPYSPRKSRSPRYRSRSSERGRSMKRNTASVSPERIEKEDRYRGENKDNEFTADNSGVGEKTNGETKGSYDLVNSN